MFLLCRVWEREASWRGKDQDWASLKEPCWHWGPEDVLWPLWGVMWKINAKLHDGVCQCCKEVLEWRVKYSKYKPLSKPKKCVKCLQKTVKDSYHIMCRPCACELEVCAKCGKKEDVVIPWVFLFMFGIYSFSKWYVNFLLRKHWVALRILRYSISQ